MKYAIMVLALVGVLARPTAAIAGATGNAMLSACKETSFLCATYAMDWRAGHMVAQLYTSIEKGLSDAKAYDALSRTASTGICIPEKVTNRQLGDVLMNHLRAHPETRHRPISLITQDAFTKAFPCPHRPRL